MIFRASDLLWHCEKKSLRAQNLTGADRSPAPSLTLLYSLLWCGSISASEQREKWNSRGGRSKCGDIPPTVRTEISVIWCLIHSSGSMPMGRNSASLSYPFWQPIVIGRGNHPFQFHENNFLRKHLLLFLVCVRRKQIRISQSFPFKGS